MDIGTIRYFNATVNVDKFTYKQGDKIIVKDLYVGESGVKQSSVITTKGNDNEYWYVRSLNADFTPEITENDEIVDTTTTTTTTTTTNNTDVIYPTEINKKINKNRNIKRISIVTVGFLIVLFGVLKLAKII